MKLEKLIKTLQDAVDKGVPLDCEISKIETQSIDFHVEAISVYVDKGNTTYKIHASWQTEF